MADPADEPASATKLPKNGASHFQVRPVFCLEADMQNTSKLGWPFSSRLYPESATLLDELVAEEDRSKNAIIRRALDFYAKSRITAGGEVAKETSPQRTSTASPSRQNARSFTAADTSMPITAQPAQVYEAR